MPYATAADLETALSTERYQELTDRDSDGSPDVGAIDAALAEACSIVDSYIGRYLPLASTPTSLRRKTIDIAVYHLAGYCPTDDERKRFEDAMLWLKDVSRGVASLGLPPAEEDLDVDLEVDARDSELASDQTRCIV